MTAIRKPPQPRRLVPAVEMDRADLLEQQRDALAVMLRRWMRDSWEARAGMFAEGELLLFTIYGKRKPRAKGKGTR